MNCQTAIAKKVAHKKVSIKVGKGKKRAKRHIEFIYGDYIDFYVDIEPPMNKIPYEAIWRAKDMLHMEWVRMAKQKEGIVK